MSRSFIQIKNKDSIYTIGACKMTIVKTEKKTSEIFYYDNNSSFKKIRN